MQRMNWTPSSDTNLASLEFVCKAVPMVVIASRSKIDSFSKAKEHGTWAKTLHGNYWYNSNGRSHPVFLITSKWDLSLFMVLL